VRTLLSNDLPALGERVQLIRDGKAATNAAENDRQLERSQVRMGGCGWLRPAGALQPWSTHQPSTQCTHAPNQTTTGGVQEGC
jgi:hypothetical protein